MAGRDDLVERRIREQSCDRQLQLGLDDPAVHHDDPAAGVRQAPHGAQHVVVLYPDDDDVVCVVRDRRGQRAAAQPEAADETEPDAAGTEVPFDDCDLEEVAAGVRERLGTLDERLVHKRLGDDLVGDDPDYPGAAVAFPRHGEIVRRQRPDADRVAHPLGHLDPRNLSHGPARLEHELGHEALQVGEDEDVRLVAGRERAEVTQAVPLGRVERGHDERVLGRDSSGDRSTNHRVDVSLVSDVLGLPVVGAESETVRAELVDEREQRVEVPGAGRLADQHPHACT